MPIRINQLIELDESRRNALDRNIINQEKVKRTFEKYAKPRTFSDWIYNVVVGQTKKSKENMGNFIVSR